jgi:GWxTD domain-containing protein
MLAFLTILLLGGAQAAHQSSDNLDTLTFWADTASFFREDGLVYTEIYLQVMCREFVFHNEGDLRRGTYRVEATLADSQGVGPAVYDAEGLALDRLAWDGVLTVPSERDLESQVAVEVLGFKSPPGLYQLRLNLRDPSSSRESAMELPVGISKPDRLSISDLQLAHRIDENPAEGRQLKNGLWVVPNVTRTVIQKSKTLLTYFEIYGLSRDSVKADAFDLAYALKDSTGFSVKLFTSTRYRKPGSTCVKTEQLDLPELEPGRYSLEVTVRDADTREIARRIQTLHIASAPPTFPPDPAALARFERHLLHLTDQSELKTYRRLEPGERVAYILQFWKERDPTPETRPNEFVIEHFRRVRYADERFSSRPKEEGSDTHQGRVHIRYGPPSDIERSPHSATGKPYETWTYENLGYYKFVFLDRLGDGVYELIHSTMPGERYNPSWRDQQAIGDQFDPLATPDGFSRPSEDEP